MLTTTQRDALLALARETARRAAAGERADGPGPAPEGLAGPGAAFVTVRVGGELRGCIGTFEALRAKLVAFEERPK